MAHSVRSSDNTDDAVELMLSIHIHNVTEGDDFTVSDYHYRVLVNTDQIASGKILGHRRTDGWQELVQMMLDVDFADAINPTLVYSP